MNLLVAVLAFAGAVVDLSAAELASAQRGAIPVRTETFNQPSGKAAGRGMGAVVVDRPLPEVWAVLTRFEDKAEYMPRLKSVTVLERQPGRLRVRMVVDASVLTTRYTAWYTMDQAAWTLSWNLDASAPDNGIIGAQGAYRLQSLGPQRTLVLYHGFVDSGRKVPRFIQDYMTRKSIPDVLRAIKSRVESDGRWRRR